MLGSFAKPESGLSIVLGDTLAAIIEDADSLLRRCISLIGRLLKPAQSLGVGFVLIRIYAPLLVRIVRILIYGVLLGRVDLCAQRSRQSECDGGQRQRNKEACPSSVTHELDSFLCF